MGFPYISSQATSAEVPKILIRKMPSPLALVTEIKRKYDKLPPWIPVFYSTRKQKMPILALLSPPGQCKCPGPPVVMQVKQGELPTEQENGEGETSDVPAGTETSLSPCHPVATWLQVSLCPFSPDLLNCFPFTARLQAAQELEASALKDIHLPPQLLAMSRCLASPFPKGLGFGKDSVGWLRVRACHLFPVPWKCLVFPFLWHPGKSVILAGTFLIW